jgi:hypothetical protein
MQNRERFSERFNFGETEQVEITVRQDAPDKLRGVLPIISNEVGISPEPLRKIVCGFLRELPDPNNWSEYPNIQQEVVHLLQNCKWYKVYDVIEEISLKLKKRGDFKLCQQFEDEINKFFYENGIGWKLENEQIEVRGSEAFEKVLDKASETLNDQERNTTTTEIHEALNDLSRRPDPDLTGAIQHGMAALECLSRDVSNSKDTLGKLIKNNPDLFPKPLDNAIEKIWGYASNRGRHLIEDEPPTHEEAELIVGLACVLATYLNKKFDS